MAPVPTISMAFPPELLDAMADALAPRLAERLSGYETAPEGGWMTTAQAADYLALTVDAIHKYTAACEIPCHEDRAGGKKFFQRAELDAWRKQ